MDDRAHDSDPRMPLRHNHRSNQCVWPYLLIDDLTRTRKRRSLNRTEFSASVGTVYAILLGEWLWHAAPAPAMPDHEIRKFVLKRLDGEAQS